MSKDTPFANEEVMEDYLNSLLSDTVDPVEVTERTAKLLEQATVDLAPQDAKQKTDGAQPLVTPADEVIEHVNTSVDEAAQKPPQGASLKPLEERLENTFQALFFEVAGLTLAVPLITLGGIHNLGKIGPLFGKPSWFMGVMIHRDEKFNVVNTAQWVMPEKYDQTLEDQLHYQYLIMLSDSEWGLASDKLVNTVSLSKEDVKWRQVSAKRPWLAGMVKDRMCALLDVDELIVMLNNGLGSKDQVP